MIKDSEINQFLILGQKYCTKCLQYKDKELFVRDASKSCGYYSSCIACNKDRRKKYYLENSDAIKEKVKLWATDTFNNQQVVEFDKEEVKHAAEARKRRMLKLKPPSPYKDPYDPYQ